MDKHMKTADVVMPAYEGADVLQLLRNVNTGTHANVHRQLIEPMADMTPQEAPLTLASFPAILQRQAS